MIPRTLPLLTALLASSTTVHAQRFLVAQDNPPGAQLVDTSAGALVEAVFYDLSILAPPPTAVKDAQRVGPEVWITAREGIHRFDAVTQAYLGAIATGLSGHWGMDVAGGSVWVAARGFLLELAFDGTVVAQHAVDDALDVFVWNGELIVSNHLGDRIDRYDPSGTFLGSIVAGTPGGFLPPGAIAPRPSSGNLLVVNLPRVREYDLTGTLLAEYQAGPFEQGLQEMDDGRLFVTDVSSASITDTSGTATGGPIAVQPLSERQLRYVSPFDTGSGAHSRYCQGAPNSVGPGAILSAIGFPRTSAALGDLQLSVVGLPGPVLGLFVYGATSTQVPFGDGFLCVPLGSGAFRFPAASISSPAGRLLKTVDLSALPAAGQVTPGSSWNFQYLYRDRQSGGSGFNGSDAVAVTFQL